KKLRHQPTDSIDSRPDRPCRRHPSRISSTSPDLRPVLLFVIVPVSSAAGSGHPVGVLLIPANRFTQSCRPGFFRAPLKFRFSQTRIDCIAPVVAQSVLDEPK